MPSSADRLSEQIRAAALLTALVVFAPSLCAEDWPWFLGPRHTGVSGETDVSLEWSDDGPAVLWKQQIGTGYSAPSVLGDRVVVHHREDREEEKEGSDDPLIFREEIVSCRSVKDGSELWQYVYPSTFQDPYGYNNGPRASPVLHDGRCFTLGAEGMLVCVALDSGQLLWKHDLQNDFDLPEWFFGVGCSPVVDGDRLFVLVGGQPNSGVVAFNTADGKVLWQRVGRETWDGVIDTNSGAAYEWTGDEMVVSYSSPILAEIHGRKHLLCLMRQGLVSVDPETGDENFKYWFRSKTHDSVNAARPVVVGSQILLSAAYRVGSALLQVAEDGRSVEEVWRSDDNLLAHWSTPVPVDGFVYGFSGRHESEGDLRCIRLQDGKVMWQSTGFEGPLDNLARDRTTGKIVNKETGREVPYPYFGRGSLIQVGDRFVVLGERGTLAVVKVNPQEFEELRRTSFDEIHYPAWAAPVLSNGQLYLRSEDWLLCVNAGK